MPPDTTNSTVPAIRIDACDDRSANRSGQYVLYWMLACRRIGWNFGLQRAVEWAVELGKPLIIFEDLRCGKRWDTDRSHIFALQAMAEHADELASRPIFYYPFVENEPGQADNLLEPLAKQACVVVTDDHPIRENRKAVDQLASKSPVRIELVDSNGLLPLKATDKVFTSAFSFRRFLQRELPSYLADMPRPDPFEGIVLPQMTKLPETITNKWPAANPHEMLSQPAQLAKFNVDHSVAPVQIVGGTNAALGSLRKFLKEQIRHYPEYRDHPDYDIGSGLSPYLRAGHISVHQIFAELASMEGWSISNISPFVSGRREGWWGMSPAAEAWLDQLVTWREIGLNMCAARSDYDYYESLPNWAKTTLEKHSTDLRDYLYSPDDLEQARTHDDLWNAAQNQLVREGRLHNYVRMLWGKKIVEWSPNPREALDVMIHLNNKYALDGCDPNSYTGIFWCLGRYDRPWGPERRVFGTVRYMSTENARRKLKLREYINRYA